MSLYLRLDLLFNLVSRFELLFLSGRYLKKPVRFVTTIDFLLFLISFKVSKRLFFKSGDIATATLVKKSSIGNK